MEYIPNKKLPDTERQPNFAVYEKSFGQRILK
jgi:hypothetical protein